jgi:hypothetical protein
MSERSTNLYSKEKGGQNRRCCRPTGGGKTVGDRSWCIEKEISKLLLNTNGISKIHQGNMPCNSSGTTPRPETILRWIRRLADPPRLVNGTDRKLRMSSKQAAATRSTISALRKFTLAKIFGFSNHQFVCPHYPALFANEFRPPINENGGRDSS